MIYIYALYYQSVVLPLRTIPFLILVSLPGSTTTDRILNTSSSTPSKAYDGYLHSGSIRQEYQLPPTCLKNIPATNHLQGCKSAVNKHLKRATQLPSPVDFVYSREHTSNVSTDRPADIG